MPSFLFAWFSLDAHPGEPPRARRAPRSPNGFSIFRPSRGVAVRVGAGLGSGPACACHPSGAASWSPGGRPRGRRHRPPRRYATATGRTNTCLFSRMAASSPRSYLAPLNSEPSTSGTGRLREAEAQFRRALELRPTSAPALPGSAVVDSRLGEPRAGHSVRRAGARPRPRRRPHPRAAGGDLRDRRALPGSGPSFREAIQRKPAAPPGARKPRRGAADAADPPSALRALPSWSAASPPRPTRTPRTCRGSRRSRSGWPRHGRSP